MRGPLVLWLRVSLLLLVLPYVHKAGFSLYVVGELLVSRQD